MGGLDEHSPCSEIYLSLYPIWAENICASRFSSPTSIRTHIFCRQCIVWFLIFFAFCVPDPGRLIWARCVERSQIIRKHTCKKTSEVGIREPEDIAVWVASTYVHSSVEVNVWVVRTGGG